MTNDNTEDTNADDEPIEYRWYLFEGEGFQLAEMYAGGERTEILVNATADQIINVRDQLDRKIESCSLKSVADDEDTHNRTPENPGNIDP